MEEIITGKKWDKVSTRRTTIHRHFDFSEASDVGLQKLVGENIPESVIVSKNGEIFYYQPTASIERFNNALKKFLENKINIQNIEDRMIPESRDFIQWLQDNCSNDKIEKLSNAELKDLLIQRHQQHIVLVTWQWFGFSGKYVLDSILARIFDKYQISKPETFEIVYKHQKPVYTLEEELNIKKIALKLKEGGSIDGEVKSHLEKYQGVYMYDENYAPMTGEQIIERVNKSLENNLLEVEIVNAEAEFSQNRTNYLNFLKSQSFSEEDLIYIDFAQVYSEFMELRNLYRGLAAFYSKDLYLEIAKKLGISLLDVLAYSDYEIGSFLELQNPGLEAEAIRRRKYAVLVYNHQDWKALPEDESLQAESIITTVEKVSEFKGEIAFKAAAVTGKVKIINSVADMPKLNLGDILVSSMTRPEFIMSIERAAAIITDEGGMLCHAAIISRELKKPCITGTKIATQVLKDGDMVEVDANNGVVRIIK